MDNELKQEMDSMKLKIDKLNADKCNYMEKFETSSDSTKPIFLQLALEVEKQIVEYEKQKTLLLQSQSRPSTPMSIDDPISSFEEKTIIRMKDYLYLVDGIIACATAIGPNMLASCYHCIQHCVEKSPDGDELQSHRNAVIVLTHAVTKRKIIARISVFSVERDVVLLQTDESLMAENELEFREAYFGQSYFLLGTPITDDGAPVQVISGRISSKLERSSVSAFGHSLHGHGSARPGASGGPVFARSLSFGKVTLLGIVVAGQKISQDTTLGTFVSSNYVKIISFATLHDISLLWKEGKYKV